MVEKYCAIMIAIFLLYILFVFIRKLNEDE